jgi:hypothetical protein
LTIGIFLQILNRLIWGLRSITCMIWIKTRFSFKRQISCVSCNVYFLNAITFIISCLFWNYDALTQIDDTASLLGIILWAEVLILLNIKLSILFHFILCQIINIFSHRPKESNQHYHHKVFVTYKSYSPQEEIYLYEPSNHAY